MESGSDPGTVRGCLEMSRNGSVVRKNYALFPEAVLKTTQYFSDPY